MKAWATSLTLGAMRTAGSPERRRPFVIGGKDSTDHPEEGFRRVHRMKG